MQPRPASAPSAEARPSLPEPNHVVGNGRYTLLWMLGQGGKCMVWLARDDRLNESVALKFLMPEACQDARMISDLRKEALRSRRLGHKNIVQLYDLYEASAELPFMIMEYVDGASLHTLRVEEERQFLPWAYVRPLTLQLCHALDHAHSEGMVHRDLKPANIMVDRHGHVKLADFGISAAVNDAYTHVFGLRDTRGTVTFMSPQQMNGDPPAPADDIYALGATLYELLAGRAPFFSGDIAHQVRHVPPQPIQACLKEQGISNPIPPPVAAIIMACLRKNPAERPRTIWEIARAIDPEVGNEIVVRVRPTVGLDEPTAAAKPNFSREFVIVMIVLGLLLVLVLVTLYFAIKAGI
ncbi:MAG: serine/threonine protein kinase [Pedosphaera sp.]|nr:serine/threonine protein kinase [Pedosphaera sp.]